MSMLSHSIGLIEVYKLSSNPAFAADTWSVVRPITASFIELNPISL